MSRALLASMLPPWLSLKARDVRRRIALRWREFATAERRTAWHLLSRGFLFRREPIFVTGRKPDFLTFGRGRMWVEVKEFDPPVSQALLDAGWRELTQRLEKITHPCRIDAWIAPGFNQRAAKQVTHLLAQELKAGPPVGHELYIAVPSGTVDAAVVRLSWKRRNGTPVQLLSLRCVEGVYGYPLAAEPEDWTADLQIVDDSTVTAKPAFKVLQVRQPARVMLRVEVGGKGAVLGSLGNAEMQDVNTVDRLRDVIDDANDQVKSGHKHRAVPAVLVVYFDHLGGGQESDVLRACLGDLMASIDPNVNAISRTFYGHNGVFRPNKNTAISAIIYLSRHYPAMSLVNPYARYPVKRAWLDGTVYWIDSSGTVRSD